MRCNTYVSPSWSLNDDGDMICRPSAAGVSFRHPSPPPSPIPLSSGRTPCPSLPSLVYVSTTRCITPPVIAAGMNFLSRHSEPHHHKQHSDKSSAGGGGTSKPAAGQDGRLGRSRRLFRAQGTPDAGQTVVDHKGRRGGGEVDEDEDEDEEEGEGEWIGS